MGPEEKVFMEGFDDLYHVDQDYKIPPPSPFAKERLTNMVEADRTKNIVEQQGFDSAMDNVFGRKAKQVAANNFNQGEVMNNAPMMTGKPAFQVVQPGATQLNIVVIEPRSFDDSLEIVNHLKIRKSVIVNLQYLDREVSQRVIDFVSGATLALDGTQERVGHGVFIFASMNCQVQTESEGIRAYKDLFAKTFG